MNAYHDGRIASADPPSLLPLHPVHCRPLPHTDLEVGADISGAHVNINNVWETSAAGYGTARRGVAAPVLDHGRRRWLCI